MIFKKKIFPMSQTALLPALFLFTTISRLCTEEIENHHKYPKATDTLYATVFIHGIVSIKPFLTIPNIIKFLRDQISHTHYAHTVQLIRHDEFFYQHQPLGQLGLQKIAWDNHQYTDATTLLAELSDQFAKEAGDTRQWHYYSYGWSGLLSPRMRHYEAEILYKDLIDYFFNHIAHNNLYIRLICYSHGGNVALKLAELFAQEKDPIKQQFKINELVLIGSPVLTETDYLINSPLFGKIYHFYSYGDRVQRMDCFSVNRIASNRKFKERSDFKIPAKLKQVQISVRRPAKEPTNRICTLQEKILLAQKKSVLRTADPGHTELWSFGWIPGSYRTQFPLNPLPYATLLPYMIHTIESTIPWANYIKTELHPRYGCLELTDLKQKESCWVNFLDHAQLNAYKKRALSKQPQVVSKKEYNDRIFKAKREARGKWHKQLSQNYNKSK